MTTIHFRGDSISRGWALREYSETLSATHPLYQLHSIQSTMGLLFFNNAAPMAAWYSGFAIGVVDGGSGGAVFAAEIEEMVRTGIIRSGDFVVIEDAGPHSCDPDQYQADMLALRQAVSSRHDVTCVMMTMFDYPTSGGNAPLADNCKYDLAFNGRTINDATRAAATADTDCYGQTILVDMNAVMDAWHEAMLYARGISAVHIDGIHPNVWGQLMMTGEILRATRLRRWIRSVEPVAALCEANYQFLGYGTAHPSWSPGTARAWAEYCLRP